MPITVATSLGAHVASPCDAGYVLILAWDAFRADIVRRCASAACPQLKSRVCHAVADALAQLRRRPTRLGVISVGAAGGAEAELLARVHEERLLARVLLIAEQRDHRLHALARLELVHGVFDSGAEPPPLLTRAIREVAGGRRYYSASLDHAFAPNGAVAASRPNGHSVGLFRPDEWEAVAARLHLSRREVDIVRRLFENQGESVIAAELGVSPRTIHTHLERLHAKLGVHYRAELILRIVREFLSHPGAAVSAG